MRSLAGTVLLIAAVTLIPAVCGWMMAPEGTFWTGLIRRNTADVSVYLSLIEETRRDGILAHNLYTPEPHPAFILRPTYCALGLVGKALPFAPSLVLKEAGRLLSALVLLGLLSYLARRAGRDPWERVLALLVLAAAGGIGWMGVGNLTTDLGSPEGSTFVTLLSPPHFPVSLALLLGVILALERTWTAEEGRRAAAFSLLAAVLGLWLGFEHPFDLVPLGLAVSAALGVEWARRRAFPLSQLLRALPLAGTAGAAILVQVLLLQSIPIYAEWNRQNVVPSAPIGNIVASLGLLIPLALVGIRPLWRESAPLGSLVALYAAAALLCSRLPVAPQARFLEGYPLCFAIAAAWGLLDLTSRVTRPAAARALGCLLVAALLPSSFAVLAEDVTALARRSPPQYLPRAFLDGLRATGEMTSPGEVVLSSFPTGNFLPAYSSRQVFLGSRVQTARFEERYEVVARLFRLGPSHPEAEDLLVRSGADVLFWGPEEKHLSAGSPQPSDAPWLDPVWGNELVTLFRVKR